MRRAIIVGHSGQDGSILWEQLAAKGFSLIGISRHQLRVHEAQWHEAVDITDAAGVRRLVDGFRPDQIYYLAAHHHSSQQQTAEELAMWQASWTVHTRSFLHFLDAIRACHSTARIFYAGSSRLFGQVATSPQTENTPFRPSCVYGATKAMGVMLADYHRRNHGVFASCGVLFNHESPLRGREFVSQRVVDGLVGLKTGRAESLQIGNLGARVDWGYAPDYTRAMQLILEADAPDDFVIASGETHSVREMIEIAAEYLDVSWEGRVVENAQILRRGSQDLCGDPSRLRRVTGWQPETSFRDMVRIMARAALAREGLAA
jgi:GDPmannose 4,6-dehydratase